MSGRIKELWDEAANNDDTSIASAGKVFSGTQEAEKAFAVLQKNLTNIAEWNRHATISSYKLFDESGEALDSNRIEIGVFIRISLKGSGKNDWVRVKNIEEAADEFILTVRPTFDPTAEKPDVSATSHFFTDESTNNFCLHLKGEKIVFYVIGLNEKMNDSETGSIVETVRNAAVNLSTYFGVQKAEWENFCRDFLEDAAEKSL